MRTSTPTPPSLSRRPACSRLARGQLAGASLAAIMLALPRPAAAQSFQGTGTVVSGSAFISEGTGTTDVFVDTPEAVIDWTTVDATNSGLVVFQPAGTVASFVAGSLSGPDYTVLNRIIPVSASGAPVNAVVQFDGTVQSSLFNGPGGNVWFFSPTGIVVGPTARFDVGGLVLTTNPIDTTGGLYGASGEIRFRGVDGANGVVTIANGAQITASGNPFAPVSNAYVALVAPRIVQAGSVRADGSIAYVAAEEADITINAGLFDIAVTQGTTDGAGIIHSGSTGGPASASAADTRVISMVAIGKNDGLTMLLNGAIGYDAAASASNDGSAVVLSAGHGLGFDAADPLTNPASIRIGDVDFTSITTARASDAIVVNPTAQLRFRRFARLEGLRSISVSAVDSASILAEDTAGAINDPAYPTFADIYSLDLVSGYGGNGGTISIDISASGAINTLGELLIRATGDANRAGAAGPDGLGGSISIDLQDGTMDVGNLTMVATARGSLADGGNGTGGTVSMLATGDFVTSGLTIDVTGGGAGGQARSGDGQGGAISLTADGGRIGAYSMQLNADGYGGDAVIADAGSGTGGIIGLLVTSNGTLMTGGPMTLAASGVGGGGGLSLNGGDGSGGAITLSGTGGPIDTSYVSLNANGFGGYTDDARAGDGRGGSALVSLSGTDQSWTDLTIRSVAEGGVAFSNAGQAGNAIGDSTNGVGLRIDGALLDIFFAVDLAAESLAPVRAGPATTVSGGLAEVSVSGGGILSVGYDTRISAQAAIDIEQSSASDPTYSATMTGGVARALLDGGRIITTDLKVSAAASGIGATVAAGAVTGGQASVVVSNGGDLQLTGDPFATITGLLDINADADGNTFAFFDSGYRTVTDGVGVNAQGGTALLQMDGGSIGAVGAVTVSANGFGGHTGIQPVPAQGGNGTGGTARLAIGGGSMDALDVLTIQASGLGGAARNGITGGGGTGGLATLDSTGGTLIVDGSGLNILATGQSPDVLTGDTAASGEAQGGTARLAATGGIIDITGATTINANGHAGLARGLAGGNGTGGTALLDARATADLLLTGAASVLAQGHGGSGTGSGGLGGNGAGGNATTAQSGGGILGFESNLTVDATARGGNNAADNQATGLAAGGTASLLSQSQTLLVNGDASLLASATGGANPVSGTPSPTIAGAVQLGGIDGAAGGAITISGALLAEALGDAARGDGRGLFADVLAPAITVGGAARLRATANAALMLPNGGLDAAGPLLIQSLLGSVNATGTLAGAVGIQVLAAGDIGLQTLNSGATTTLAATNGALRVDNLLSTGTVSATGGSVAITSTAGLNFATASATNGALMLDTADQLIIATTDATGAVTLISRNAAVTASGPVSGAQATITAATGISLANAVTATTGALALNAGGPIAAQGPLTAATTLAASAGTSLNLAGTLASQGALTLQAGQNVATTAAITSGAGLTITAGGDINADGNLAAQGDLAFAAGQLLAVNAVAQGSAITARSADIAIGTAGRIGTRGTTQQVTFNTIPVSGATHLGGTGGGAGDFSLDSAEWQRVFADRGITVSAAAASLASELIVHDLALAFGSGQTLGSGATLALTTTGTARVLGDLALTTTGSTDGLALSAGQIEVVTDAGSLRLTDGSGAPTGLLDISVDRFIAATSDTLQQLATATDATAINALLDAPGGNAVDSVAAGTITASVADALLVQNSGTGTDYADRRGLLAGALDITTGGTATLVAINGATLDASGNPVTGLDTVATITINGVAPAAGGQFDPASSVNGCVIGQNCTGLPDDPSLLPDPAKPDLTGPLDPTEPPASSSLPVGEMIVIASDDVDRENLLPLVDEPVTGVGNEDLWGDACPSGEEGCTGGQ